MNSLLIIDCGHSRTKFHSYAAKVQHISCDNIPFKWPSELKAENYSECLIMGTNEAMSIRWLSHLKQQNAPTPMVLGKDCRVPVIKKCGEGTGNDRMVHALGAKKLYPEESVLIVSAGSALVVDLVNDKGELEGGSIGMGWGFYQKSMVSLNSNLKSSLEKVTFPGIETEHAVALGWKLGVKALVAELARIYPMAYIVTTGGDGKMMTDWWPNCQYVENLGIDDLAEAFGYKKADS